MALIALVRAELHKRGKKGTDAEVWAELRDGEFKAVMAGYMNFGGNVYDVTDDPVTGRGRTTSTAWMVAHWRVARGRLEWTAVARESQKRKDFWVGKTPLSVVFFSSSFFPHPQNGYPVHVSTKKEPVPRKKSVVDI